MVSFFKSVNNARNGPMLPISAQYGAIAGPFRHVYKVSGWFIAFSVGESGDGAMTDVEQGKHILSFY